MTQAEHSVAGGTIVRAAALVPVPWANGGGITRIIADRAEFRLSLATINADGPFSSLPGLIRHLALVAGRIRLGPGAVACDAASPPFEFDGAGPIDAQVIEAPALALNLMVPRGAARLRLIRCGGGVITGAHAVFACAAVTVDGLALAAHDTLFPTGPVGLSGPALVVR